MDICLAILSYLFNNNNQFDKTYFISKLLNNKGFNPIYVYYRDANSASRISFLQKMFVLEQCFLIVITRLNTLAKKINLQLLSEYCI